MVRDVFDLTTGSDKIKKRRAADLNILKTKLASRIEQNNGIATILDAYECAVETFKKYTWSTLSLEQLSRYLMSCPEFFRIDLMVTKDGKGRLPIFPGHHGVSSTSFFVTRKDDQTEDIKKAEELLQLLVDNYKASLKKSTKPKTQMDIMEMIDPKEKKEEKKEKKEKNETINKAFAACHATTARPNGFISSTRLRLQLLHSAIAKMYQYNVFTPDQFIQDMPLSLYNSLVGIDDLPKVLKDEPLLFNVCMKCFPDSFLKLINFENGREEIRRLLLICCGKSASIKDLFYFIVFLGNNKFQLMKTQEIDFPPDIFVYFKLANVDDIDDYWRTLSFMELLENVDPQSNPIWRKRYSLLYESGSRASGITKPALWYLQSYFAKKGFISTFPILPFNLEPFVSNIGYNYSSIEFQLVQFREGPRKEELERLFTPNTGAVALFCKGDSADGMQFTMNPVSIIEKMDKTQTFKWLKDVKAHVALNYLTAQYSLSPTGVIVSLIRQWSTIYDLIKTYGTPTEEELKQLQKTHSAHIFSMAFFKDYKDLFEYNKASGSYRTRFGKANITDGIDLQTSDYNSSMLVQHLGYKVDPLLGEVIERMKIISLSPTTIFNTKTAEQLLTHVDYQQVPEGVVYLKFTKFLQQPDENIEDSPYRFSIKNLIELKIHFPISYFADMLRDMKYIQKASHLNPSLNGLIKSAPGSCTYLIHPSCQASIVLAPEKFSLGSQLLSSIAPQSKTALSQDETVFDIFSISIKSIPLPQLQDVALEPFEDLTVSDTIPTNDFQIYPASTCLILHNAMMQEYVIYFQVSQAKDLNFLLFIRFLYEYIMMKFIKGASLQNILSFFGEHNLQTILKCLAFLDEYNFISTIHSTAVMPQYVADVFSAPHMILRTANKTIDPENDETEEKTTYYDLTRPHYWVRIDGEVSNDIITPLRNTVLSILNEKQGIEFLDLADQMSSVPLSDILNLLDAMESDEIVSTRYMQPEDYFKKQSKAFFIHNNISLQEEDEDIFMEEVYVPIAPISNTEFLLQISRFMEDPLNNERTKKYIYLTPDAYISEALALQSTAPEKLSPFFN